MCCVFISGPFTSGLSSSCRRSRRRLPPPPPPSNFLATVAHSRSSNHTSVVCEQDVLPASSSCPSSPTSARGRQLPHQFGNEGGEEVPFAPDWMHSWLANHALNRDAMIRFGRLSPSRRSFQTACDTSTHDQALLSQDAISQPVRHRRPPHEGGPRSQRSAE